MRIEQGALICFFNLGDDLSHTIGAKKGRAFCAFDFAHFFCDLGALIQQVQQLLIERINLNSQFAQGV